MQKGLTKNPYLFLRGSAKAINTASSEGVSFELSKFLFTRKKIVEKDIDISTKKELKSACREDISLRSEQVCRALVVRNYLRSVNFLQKSHDDKYR